MGGCQTIYMTLSWTHDLAEHMTTGGAQSGSVTTVVNCSFNWIEESKNWTEPKHMTTGGAQSGSVTTVVNCSFNWIEESKNWTEPNPQDLNPTAKTFKLTVKLINKRLKVFGSVNCWQPWWLVISWLTSRPPFYNQPQSPESPWPVLLLDMYQVSDLLARVLRYTMSRALHSFMRLHSVSLLMYQPRGLEFPWRGLLLDMYQVSDFLARVLR